MVEEVIGHVIRILNEYEIIIDVGKKQGIVEDDKFVVYNEGEEILDLEGNSLGKLELVKANVEVIKVQDNYSICSAYKIKKINELTGLGALAGLNTINMLAGYETKTEKKRVPLNVDEEDFEDTITSGHGQIKKGDLVKLESD